MKKIGKYYKKYSWMGLGLYIAKKLRLPITLRIQIPETTGKILLRPHTTDVSVFEKIFINEEYGFPVSQPPKVHVIVDAGANIGLASLYFSIMYPDAKIISIEPEESNYDMLKKNVQAHSNIFPLKKALWNTSNALKISNPDDRKYSFHVEESEHGGTVQGITMNELMSMYNLHHIDILKIDIEGAEKELFSDKPEWLERVGMIIIEFHDRKKPGCSRSFYTAVDPYIREEHRKGENAFVFLKDNNAGL